MRSLALILFSTFLSFLDASGTAYTEKIQLKLNKLEKQIKKKNEVFGRDWDARSVAMDGLGTLIQSRFHQSRLVCDFLIFTEKTKLLKIHIRKSWDIDSDDPSFSNYSYEAFFNNNKPIQEQWKKNDNPWKPTKKLPKKHLEKIQKHVKQILQFVKLPKEKFKKEETKLDETLCYVFE